MAMNAATGTVTRVSGPVVHLSGLPDVTRFEYVEVGDDRLPGEIISVRSDEATAQLYEYSGSLRVGQPAYATGHPLTVELGPGLLGGIYDGLLRPLANGDDFLTPRPLTRPPATRHDFHPTRAAGDGVAAGDVIGLLSTGGSVEHRVVVPQDVGGPLEWLAPAGEHTAGEVIAVVDGRDIRSTSEWPIRHPRPAARRQGDVEPFHTGQRVLDVLAPIARGTSATVIGGFGEGKTMLLEQLAKWSDADVIVYVGCGERGNELTDLIDELTTLIDPRTGRRLMERTIILANTSNMPVMAREASIYTAATVAEFYRDMGHHVVLIADSTSRWAEAQRELAGRTGAIPAEEGYPADLPAALAAFYQRAGHVTTIGGLVGSVTIVTSVSPPGGDLTEPVSAHTQRFVQAVWTLDRDLAYARHYPAVSWQLSFSRSVDRLGSWHSAHGDPEWAVRRARLRSLLNESDRLQDIADLVGATALPTEERLVLLTSRLARLAVFQQNALSSNDATCALDKQAALTEAVLAVHDEALSLTRDGLPVSVLETFDFGRLIRAKDDTGPDDAAGVRRITADVLRDLAEIAS